MVFDSYDVEVLSNAAAACLDMARRIEAGEQRPEYNELDWTVNRLQRALQRLEMQQEAHQRIKQAKQLAERPYVPQM